MPRVKFMYDLPKEFLSGRSFKAGDIAELSNSSARKVIHSGYATLNLKMKLVVEEEEKEEKQVIEIPDFDKMKKDEIKTWAELNLELELDTDELTKTKMVEAIEIAVG